MIKTNTEVFKRILKHMKASNPANNLAFYFIGKIERVRKELPHAITTEFTNFTATNGSGTIILGRTFHMCTGFVLFVTYPRTFLL